MCRYCWRKRWALRLASNVLRKSRGDRYCHGKALAHTKEIDKALSVGAVGVSLVWFCGRLFVWYGFEPVQRLRTQSVAEKMFVRSKHVIHKFKHMWTHMKGYTKKCGLVCRKAVIHAVKAFIVSLVELLKEGLNICGSALRPKSLLYGWHDCCHVNCEHCIHGRRFCRHP